ncbi:MAG TPA: adenylate/guanylate cyclase domain-containing protein [Actinomycetota bacterium]|nr:adenylate/guanylate cyclase domain-containing protein [Actinomycetota bacterium]
MPACPSCGRDNPARARFCMTCGGPLQPPASAGEVRKTVTVVFCDVVGSTRLGERLDPEAVRRVMARFFREMQGVLERHGGTVEKFIGDAVMAVFGVPVLHEDDALRAVRAAVEMRDALGRLNADLETSVGVSLETRTGINSGEVVAGTPLADDHLVIGDAVNVAARLQQAASPGEILVGRETSALIHGAVEVDEATSLVLKGKTEPVTAHRVVRLIGAGIEPIRPEPPFVGRAVEVDLLRREFERAVAERSCRMVTVLGVAGVGKSRLAREFTASVSDRARSLVGRCLPYGDGITFWPIAEIVRAVAGIEDGDRPARARAKLDDLMRGADDAAHVTAGVAAAIGISGSEPGIQETFWAIRRLLERVAHQRPTILVLDDLQWGEPTLLDLLEYLVGSVADAPILVLVVARPELLEERPSWSAISGTASVLSLEPLDRSETGSLLEHLLGEGALDPALVGRISAAGGNPLFVEELLRMLRDDGRLRNEDGRWVLEDDPAGATVPPTIQALLAARLDRLGHEERTVIGSAAVIGKVFWWGAVAALVPEDLRPEVGRHLQALVRRELIQPHPSTFVGEDAFRFRHLLIQEAAYQGTPKEVRAELHRGFAAWLEAHAPEGLVGIEEILGYHLEQAFTYRGELGIHDEPALRLGAAAAQHLGGAGRRALAAGDVPAAANLLGRAFVLLDPEDPSRLRAMSDLGEALMEVGDLERAGQILDEAVEVAGATGDRGAEAHARVVQLMLLGQTDPRRRSEDALAVLEGVIPVFEELGDEQGLARAHRLLADVHWTRNRYAETEAALREAIDHARRAGAAWEEYQALGQYTGALMYGPTPASEVAERCEEILSARASRAVEARALRTLGAVRAMQGSFDEARDLVRRSRGILEDLGMRLRAAFASDAAAFVEMLAGDPEAAERELRVGYERMERLGEQGYLATAAALLAHAVYAQGRTAIAEDLARDAERQAAEDDVTTHVLWRSAMAKVLVSRGEEGPAEDLARRALEIAVTTDDINMIGDTRMDLVQVLGISGRIPEAVEVATRALGDYETKGNTVAAGRAARFVAEHTAERA